MAKKRIPLKEVSIDEIFNSREKREYEIPIYQRNYAWEKEEIATLVQDVYDAFKTKEDKAYFIGTLVTYNKGDNVYEVIDGQQRLTTLNLLLEVLGIDHINKLSYRARKKSDDTLNNIASLNRVEEKDIGIENGYKNAKSAVGDLISNDELESFKTFFRKQVHIIDYEVPKDIDLNHYFEIMNSRGEQLEKHEIVKANLMEELNTDEMKIFNAIWEACSEMGLYIQQSIKDFDNEALFGKEKDLLLANNFDEVEKFYSPEDGQGESEKKKIVDVLDRSWDKPEDKTNSEDAFLPIIDFPNFLLIVLKLTRMEEAEFNPIEFNLDDKELLNEFSSASFDEGRVKEFAYNLLKAKYFLDNYIVHHSKEEEKEGSNPWDLQRRYEKTKGKSYYKSLSEDLSTQRKLEHILSMFEVSFTPRQRKNYLFYCLLYLFREDSADVSKYADFVENLANRYFNMVYLDKSKLNAINTPLPGSFDEVMIDNNNLSASEIIERSEEDFVAVFGDGTIKSDGVPLFVFNYLDYKIWSKYASELRGIKTKKGDSRRITFFGDLGCEDFELDFFDDFYFSRTRRSLEHYYPQAKATGEEDTLNEAQINCFGNYAMIGSAANSAGSNWDPERKYDVYLNDASGKIDKVSVASLKFMIMLQMCKNNKQWEFEEIKKHQKKMVSILLDS